MIQFWKELLVDSWKFLRENYIMILGSYLLCYGIYSGLNYGYVLYLAQGSLGSYSQFNSALAILQIDNEFVVRVKSFLPYLYSMVLILFGLLVLDRSSIDEVGKSSISGKELIGKLISFIKKYRGVAWLVLIIQRLIEINQPILLLIGVVMSAFILPFVLYHSIDADVGLEESLNYNFSLVWNNKLNLIVLFIITLLVAIPVTMVSQRLEYWFLSAIPFVGLIMSGLIHLIIITIFDTYFIIMGIKFYQKAKAKYELKISDQKN